MNRRFLTSVAATAVFIPALLLADRPGALPQLALGMATAGFLWLLVRQSSLSWTEVLTCVAVATTGEVVLSLGWGLYDYENALIPLYVPPGHGVFYALATITAQQEFLRSREKQIRNGVVAAGTLVAIVGLLLLNDVWGFLWWLGAMALIRWSRNQLLLSACLTYTMLLEWIGTAIGNWRWAAEVPFLGLPSANPPAGVGILYVLLDLIVVAICSRPQAVGELALEGARPIRLHK